MSNKLVSRLLSFTLSATVALTSGVPALAYDGGSGDLPEDEELQILEEEEDVGADFDVLEEEIVEDEEFFAVEEEEEDAEFEALDDLSIQFVTDGTVTVHDMNGEDYISAAIVDNPSTGGVDESIIGVDATRSYSFVVAPDTGFVLPSELINTATTGTFYLDYTDLVATTGAWSGSPAEVEVKKVTSDSAVGFTVSDFALDKRFKVITLNKSLLEDVLAKFADKNGKWAGRDIDKTVVKKSVRPVLTITFNAASPEKYVVNQPTAKGGATALEVIPDRRTLETQVISATPASTYQSITGIGLEGDDYDIDRAKITIRLSKDEKPIATQTIEGKTYTPEIVATMAASFDTDAVMTDLAAWDKATDKLYLYQGIINNAYALGWTVDIEIDVTQTPIAKNAISIADSTYVKVVKYGTTTAMPAEYVKSEALPLTITGLADNDGALRQIEKVEYSANGAAKVAFVITPATSVDVTVPANTDGPVVLYVTTSEKITPAITETDAGGNVETSYNAVVLAEDGTAATRAISGVPYKFSIRTNPGYKVGKVSYQIKDETKSTDLKPDANGLYTTVNVVDTLDIAVEVVAGNTKYDVTRVAAGDVTIKDENNPNPVNSGSPGPANPVYTGTINTVVSEVHNNGTTDTTADDYTIYYGYKVATHNRQYYFRAKPTASHMITGISYTMGTDTTKYEAVLVSGNPADSINGALYRTDLVTGDVVLTPTVKEFVTLSACGNNNAIITYNGKILTSSGVPVQKNTDAVITVAPKDSNYTVTKVYIGDATLGKTAGTYTLNVGAAAQTIHVDTDQTADASKYNVVFRNTANGAEESGTAATDQLKNTYDATGKLISQGLTLEVGETADLNADGALSAVVFKDGVTSSITTPSAALTLELEKVHPSDKVAVVDGGTIKGYKAGTDTITATFKVVANHNTIIYTGTLPITVVDQYTDLSIYSATSSVMEGQNLNLSVVGTNGRIGNKVTVNADDTVKKIGNIVFSFEPDISSITNKEYGFTSGSLVAKKAIDADYGEGGDTANEKIPATVTLRVAKHQSAPITVVATIYDDKGEIYKTLTKDITTVEAASYFVVPTFTMANGMTYTLDDTVPSTFLLDVSGNKKTVKIAIDVYEVVDDEFAFEAGDRLPQIKKAESKGQIKKVDQSKITYKTDVVFSVDDANDKARTTDYVTVSEAAGILTVTAAKATGGEHETVSVTPSIDGINLGTWSKDFAVTEKLANTEVTFTTASPKFAGVYASSKPYEDKDGNPCAYDADDLAIAKNSLKADYLSGYDSSVVEDATREYEEGMLYRVEESSVITLPTESDFVASTRDKRAVLVGWTLTTGNLSDLRTANGKEFAAGTVGFAPGTKIAVSGDVAFEAVWQPRYDLSAAMLTNRDIKTSIIDDEASAAAEKTVYMDAYASEITTLAKGVTVPVAIASVRPWGIGADGDPEYQAVFVTSNFTLSYAESATESQKAAVTLSGTSVTAKAIATTSEIGAIEAKFTDSEGATWTVVSSGKVAVAKEISRTVAFAKATPALAGTEYTDLTSATKMSKLTLEKSWTTAEAVVWPAAFISGTNNSFLVINDDVKVEYSIDKTGIVTYEACKDAGNYHTEDESEAKRERTGWKLNVTPVAVGTANITVTITDAAGNVCTGTLPVEVTEDKVEIQFTDKDKNAVTSIQALGNNASASADGVGVVYAKAILKEDSSSLTGTWAIDCGTGANASEIVANMISATDAGDGSGRTVISFNTSGKILGTDNKNVYVTFNDGNKTYRKQITVTTFFNLVLNGTPDYDSSAYEKVAADSADSYLFVTVDGARQLDAKKTAELEKDYPATATRIKITAADQTITRDSDGVIEDQKITIDLSKYSAEVVKDKKVVTSAEFKEWFIDDGAGEGAAGDFVLSGDEVTAVVKDLTTSDFAAGEYALTPEMGATTITSAVPSVSSITLVNEKDKNYANVTLTLKPETTADAVVVYADNFGFFALDADVKLDKYPTTPSAAIEYAAAKNGILLSNDAGTSKFAVTWLEDHAGKTNLKVYSASDVSANAGDLTKCKLLTTIPLRIDGLSVEADGTYYIEDGEKVKGVTRTIGDDTFAFGDDGKQITGSKVYKLADGTSVIIRGGKVTTAGVWTIDSDTYVTDAKGVILSGWQEYAGKKYYADPANENKAVDGFQTIDGKKYYFVSHALVTASASANEYELISGTNYYVNAAGEIAFGGLFKVAGITRLFRDDTTIVKHTDSDVVDGKIKVGGIGYIISDVDDSAEFDDIFYNAKVNWTKKFDTKYTKGTLPDIQYTVTYTSKNSGKSVTTEALHATVTCDGDYSAASTATVLTFTATADLTGYWKDADAKEAATAAPISETYKFKNGGLEGTTGQEIGGEMMVEGLEDEYFFTGSAIKPVITVTDGDMVLAQGVDYTVKYKNNTKISSKTGDEYTKTAEVTVTGKGNYAGQGQTLYFAIIDPKDEVKEDDADLTGASIRLAKDTLYYTGEFLYPSAIELKLKGGSYVTYKHQGDGVYANDDSDIPAVVTFANNINKGSATVMLTGKPNAKGVTKTLKKTFKIKAAEMNATDYTVTVDPESAAWAVKGAQPAVAVTWEGYELVPGQDFTVSYDKSNKKVGPSKVTVKGKGNFAKKLEASFTVTALPLSEDMVAAVSAVVGKKGAKVTLLDGVGNVIPTSLYTVSVFDGETDVTKTKLVADKDYTIKIAKKAGKTELGDDALEITAQAGIDIKSAKVNAKSVVKTYTGEAITLTDDDIAKIAVTYKGATLVAGTDYEITGYANNIKKGSMTVTIKGIGKYSGAKTFKVKIAPKPISSTN